MNPPSINALGMIDLQLLADCFGQGPIVGDFFDHRCDSDAEAMFQFVWHGFGIDTNSFSIA
jgi:hypothetical protein